MLMSGKQHVAQWHSWNFLHQINPQDYEKPTLREIEIGGDAPWKGDIFADGTSAPSDLKIGEEVW